jgi:hypothetical protein
MTLEKETEEVFSSSEEQRQAARYKTQLSALSSLSSSSSALPNYKKEYRI